MVHFHTRHHDPPDFKGGTPTAPLEPTKKRERSERDDRATEQKWLRSQLVFASARQILDEAMIRLHLNFDIQSINCGDKEAEEAFRLLTSAALHCQEAVEELPRVAKLGRPAGRLRSVRDIRVFLGDQPASSPSAPTQAGPSPPAPPEPSAPAPPAASTPPAAPTPLAPPSAAPASPAAAPSSAPAAGRQTSKGQCEPPVNPLATLTALAADLSAPSSGVLAGAFTARVEQRPGAGSGAGASAAMPPSLPPPFPGSFSQLSHQLFGSLCALHAAPSPSAAADRGALDQRLHQLRTELELARGTGGVLRTKPGSEQGARYRWARDFAPYVLPARCTLEWLWDGPGKSWILRQCGQLGILQGRKGTGSGAAKFGNLTVQLQKGRLEEADGKRMYISSGLDTWLQEAERERREGQPRHFSAFLLYKSECRKRDVHFMHEGDIFLRFYLALSAIKRHRDAAWFLARIVGSSGADRFVDFLLVELTKAGAVLSAAEVCEYLVEHGWGYALTGVGSGHAAFMRAASLPGMAERIDLAVAHAVRETVAACPVTMASVVDLHKCSCGGDARLAVQRHSEAVLATMVQLEGASLDGSMQPPSLPEPPAVLQISTEDLVICRARRGGLASYKNHTFPDATHLIFCRCSHCEEGYWLPASPQGNALQVCYSTAKHEPGCVASASAIVVPVRLHLIDAPPPRFREAGKPYMLKDKKKDIERWLIPTQYEALQDDDDGDGDESCSD